MSTTRGRRRWLAAVWRVLRCRPATHPQVWSLAVASALVVVGFGYLISNGHELIGNAAGSAVLGLAMGSAGSYRLSKQRDATTYADWLATRPRSRLPGQGGSGQ